MKQILAILGMNLRTILARSGSSIVIIIGIAGSVAVMVSLLAMAEGLSKTIASTGEEDRVLIFRDGANSELSSGIYLPNVAIIENMPGIRKSEDGPMISAELFTIIDLKKKGADDTSNLPLRGVEPMSFKIRPELKIIEGENFTPGRAEIIVGKGANNQYEGLDIGDQIKVRDTMVTVVGIFSTGGDVHESEIWADLAGSQGFFRRENSASIAIAQMDNSSVISDFGVALELDPRLELKVQGEAEFYSQQSSGASTVIEVFGYAVAVIMAIGAITVPAYITNTTADHEYIIKHSGARALIVSNHNLTKKVSSISINYKYSTKNIYNNIIADLDPSYSFRLGLDENPDENNNLNYSSNVSGNIFSYSKSVTATSNSLESSL